MLSESKATDRWALFGKISAVVILLCTVVGAVIAVYTLGAGKADLEATVSSSVFRAPPELKARDESTESRRRHRFDGYFILIISNRDVAQADNVVVDLPYRGVAEVRSEDGKPVQVEFSDSITVGAIRPNKRITVYAWTTDSPASYKETDIGVTHTQGVGRITFVRETAGFWNAIYQYIPGWFWLILFVLGFLPWLIQHVQREAQIDEMQKRINTLESEEDKTSGKKRG